MYKFLIFCVSQRYMSVDNGLSVLSEQWFSRACEIMKQN